MVVDNIRPPMDDNTTHIRPAGGGRFAVGGRAGAQPFFGFAPVLVGFLPTAMLFLPTAVGVSITRGQAIDVFDKLMGFDVADRGRGGPLSLPTGDEEGGGLTAGGATRTSGAMLQHSTGSSMLQHPTPGGGATTDSEGAEQTVAPPARYEATCLQDPTTTACTTKGTAHLCENSDESAPSENSPQPKFQILGGAKWRYWTPYGQYLGDESSGRAPSTGGSPILQQMDDHIWGNSVQKVPSRQLLSNR